MTNSEMHVTSHLSEQGCNTSFKTHLKNSHAIPVLKNSKNLSGIVFTKPI